MWQVRQMDEIYPRTTFTITLRGISSYHISINHKVSLTGTVTNTMMPWCIGMDRHVMKVIVYRKAEPLNCSYINSFVVFVTSYNDEWWIVIWRSDVHWIISNCYCGLPKVKMVYHIQYVHIAIIILHSKMSKLVYSTFSYSAYTGADVSMCCYNYLVVS
jgi:hypothetical protein